MKKHVKNVLKKNYLGIIFFAKVIIKKQRRNILFSGSVGVIQFKKCIFFYGVRASSKKIAKIIS